MEDHKMLTEIIELNKKHFREFYPGCIKILFGQIKRVLSEI